MLTTAGLFLIQTIFDLFIYILLLRFILEILHCDFFNPLSQFSYKFTQWVIGPLQKTLPRVPSFNLSIALLMLGLEILKLLLVMSLKLGAWPNFAGLLVLAVAELLEKAITFYFYAIIIRTIASWLSPVHHNPLFFVLHQITEPVMRPFRQMLPLVGGFDISPVIALIVLQLVNLTVVNGLVSIAYGLIM